MPISSKFAPAVEHHRSPRRSWRVSRRPKARFSLGLWVCSFRSLQGFSYCFGDESSHGGATTEHGLGDVGFIFFDMRRHQNDPLGNAPITRLRGSPGECAEQPAIFSCKRSTGPHRPRSPTELEERANVPMSRLRSGAAPDLGLIAKRNGLTGDAVRNSHRLAPLSACKIVGGS